MDWLKEARTATYTVPDFKFAESAASVGGSGSHALRAFPETRSGTGPNWGKGLYSSRLSELISRAAASITRRTRATSSSLQPRACKTTAVLSVWKAW